METADQVGTTGSLFCQTGHMSLAPLHRLTTVINCHRCSAVGMKTIVLLTLWNFVCLFQLCRTVFVGLEQHPLLSVQYWSAMVLVSVLMQTFARKYQKWQSFNH